MTNIEAPWMPIAHDEIGVGEIPGGADNPRIKLYRSVVPGNGKGWHDEVPWCADFACWCLEEAKIRSPRSHAARAFLTWGQHLMEPRAGCICVYSRPVTQPDGTIKIMGHVGFFDGWTDGKRQILTLGGNQGNKVCVKPYPLTRLLGFRYPL